MKRESNETLEQYLNRRNAEYEQALKEKQDKKKKKKSKRKGFIVAIGLGALGLVTAITGAFHLRKYNKYDEPKNKIETITDDMDLDDLGFEEEQVADNTNNSTYGNTTGNIDKNKLVEKNGTIYKDKEAADKSGQVGKEVIDDKDGSLVVQPDGTVTEKDKDYVVKDEEGNIKDTGSNESGIPEGYVWDADRGEYVKKEEAGLYIYSDATYYYGDGTVALEKGVLISKKDFEIIKKYCTTTKPVVNTATENSSNNNQQPTQEQTQTVDEGKVNVDGTYTIYGTTYMDKATFEAFLIDDNSNQNFGLYNGVIYPASVINEMNAQKSR